MRHPLVLSVGVVWLGLCATSVSGVSVESWSLSTGEEFSEGSLDGTSVDEEGRVSLAFSLATLWGPEEGIVWDVQPAGRGPGAFVALSSPGRLVRVVEGSDPETWYRTEQEALVTALAPDSAGGVYFGLSPVGEVHHAAGPGTAELAASTGALFVWAIAGGPGESLWIGTGLPGMVLRGEPDGDWERVFESGDDPVRCLAPLDDGGVLVGTGGRGRVIRIDPEGRPFVLLDADEAEIVALAAGADGTVFALAARGSKQLASSGSAGEAGGAERVRVVASAPSTSGTRPGETRPAGGDAPKAEPSKFRMQPGGALYRLDADGGSRRIWESSREVPFALALRPDGKLLVSTGDRGRIYLLDDRGQLSRLLQIPSDQASAMALRADGSVLVGGTTDARVEKLGPGPQTSGSYLGPPLDARSVADWGRLSWEADVPSGAGLEVRVRGGNTDEPDATWSDWRSLGAKPRGCAPTGLPSSRWIQARVDMSPSRSGASPVLRRVELFFRPRNRAPAIESLAVEPAGVVWTRGPTQPSRQIGLQVADDPIARKTAKSLRLPAKSPVRKSYELGAQTVRWEAEDPDEDSLVYRLEIRREGTERWFPLAAKLEDRFYSWDARGTPDGLYRVRLTADDAPGNPQGRELIERRLSPVFRIDNTRPTLGERQIRRAEDHFRVEFVASDPGGNVAAVEVAVDGGDWTPLDPVDGVADSPEERYMVLIDPHARAEASDRSVSVRVTDSAGNLGGDTWTLDDR